MLRTRVISFILALCTSASMLMMTSCSTPVEQNPEASISESSVASQPEVVKPLFVNPLPVPTAAGVKDLLNTGLMLLSQEKHKLNSDTVGWVKVPNTTLDDVVVWYPGDRNDYYLRKDFNKQESWYGSYFADYRSRFEGGRNGLPRNTVIYGHSMTDNPNDQAFSQLKKFLDIDFAENNPYVYFSTTDEDMVWEIFAIFYATTTLNYNKPYMSDAEFSEIIGECLKRSIYEYDVPVTSEDKILTLSTCCYNFTTAYPNNYRYVVMAKLVAPDEELSDTAVLVKNSSPKAP